MVVTVYETVSTKKVSSCTLKLTSKVSLGCLLVSLVGPDPYVLCFVLLSILQTRTVCFYLLSQTIPFGRCGRRYVCTFVFVSKTFIFEYRYNGRRFQKNRNNFGVFLTSGKQPKREQCLK